MRASFPLLISLILLLPGCSKETDPRAERARALMERARAIASQQALPGLAVAIVREDGEVDKVTLGTSNLASGDRVSGATPFQLASTTKIFSSAALLRLVADRKLGLDDPVGRYLDDLPQKWREVTVRQLLSHTSGLPDITRSTGELDLVAADWAGAVAAVQDRPFQFAPAQGWAYTQTNYAILQRLIEKISGTGFTAFLENRLFAPLGMTNTFFPDARRGCAVNYERGPDGKVVERRGFAFPLYVHAAGGLCSSLDDLVKWNAALDAGAVIPKSLLDEAWRPARLAGGGEARIAGTLSYGLGWAIETAPGKRWVGHSGGNSSAFRRYLDNHATIIVLHNGAADPDAIATSLARLSSSSQAANLAQDDLWDASATGDIGAMEKALHAGADINALDTRSSRNGRFALNWAAVKNQPAAILFLLKHGARIDAQNLTGFTALHHAAEAGSPDAARALVTAGADRALRNTNDETASDVARRKGHAPIQQLIDGAAPAKRGG